jgi:hypothetical protein
MPADGVGAPFELVLPSPGRSPFGSIQRALGEARVRFDGESGR